MTGRPRGFYASSSPPRPVISRAAGEKHFLGRDPGTQSKATNERANKLLNTIYADLSDLTAIYKPNKRRENDIDETVLLDLTSEDLKDLA